MRGGTNEIIHELSQESGYKKTSQDRESRSLSGR